MCCNVIINYGQSFSNVGENMEQIIKEVITSGYSVSVCPKNSLML